MAINRILPTGIEGMPGVTSKDVYNESSGKPGSGMSSYEMHHNGHASRKRETLGLAKFGVEPNAGRFMNVANRET